MKKINVAYAELQNAGDLFNKECIERYTGCEVVRCESYNADMIAIGGGLREFQYSNNLRSNIIQHMYSMRYGNRPLFVWGSGFFRNDNENTLFRKNLQICALRGELSRLKLEKLTGKKYNVPLADAGLLISEFLSSSVSKKYQVGIIPHFRHSDDSNFEKLAAKLPKSHIINIKKSAIDVAYEIAQCECIISSSLHGLIFADSLHVPSLHVIAKIELPGGLFKFQDYYSSLGLEDKVWDLSTNLPTVNDVIDSYRVSASIVDEKKQQLILSCPKF